MPSKMPEVENFRIYGWCKPADQTGGDYFDCLQLQDGRMILSIGDVTGLGIGPALVTAASRAYARAIFNNNESLDKLVARLNDLLHNDLQGMRFVTLIAVMLDPRTRAMQLVAAGHGPVLFYSKRKDDIEITEDSQGIPLGVMGDSAYDAPVHIQFEPGDVLVLVSDGFLDWMDKSDEPFGTPRMRESVLNSCRTDPDKIVERLREDIARFNQGRNQADDTTALVIRCVS
jgi:serine phosphatase RsbU (regulator of sigma subunit)